MPDSLLSILKFFLLALIWLFFLRVLRAVWVETRRTAAVGAAEAPAEPEVKPERPQERRAARRSQLRLRVLAPPQLQGQVFDLGDELTVGRAPGCGVPLEGDTFASKVHARVFRRDGSLWIEDLGSTNGTFVNSERILAPAQLHRGDRLQVGQTVLEVAR